MNKKISLTSLSIMGLMCFVLNGCAISNEQVGNNTPKKAGANVEYFSSGQGVKIEPEYLYDRPVNLEYADTKSIEKLKRAVTILIDKVDNMQNGNTSKKEIIALVDQKINAIDGELKITQQNLNDMQKIPIANTMTESKITSFPNEQSVKTYSADDEKIMQFLQKETKDTK